MKAAPAGAETPTGLDLSVDEAIELHDAIYQLREAARDHKPVRL
jgi:hypothetical protein